MTVTSVGTEDDDSVSNATVRAQAVAWCGFLGNIEGVENILRLHKNTRETSETILGLAATIARLSGKDDPLIQITMGPHMHGQPEPEVQTSYEKASALMSTMAQYIRHQDLEGALIAFQQAINGLTSPAKQTFFRSCFHVSGITIQQLAPHIHFEGDEHE